jgi:tight adherence protein B
MAMGQDGPVAQNIDLGVMKVGKSVEVSLTYTDPDNDKAVACTITSAQYVEIYKECSCADGICDVGIISKNEGRGGFTYNVTANNQTSKDAKVIVQIESSVDIWVNVLGVKGILIIIGLLIFFVSYKNSIKIFQWIDQQTHGTRDYILNKFEIMFIEVEPEKVTYGLLFMSFGMGIITFSIISLLGKLPLAMFLGLIMMFVGWKAPKPLVDFFENKRKKKYQVQMVDALNLMANGLRAGLTVPQSIGMVVDELPAPVSQEFNLILQQAKIGVPLDEALENLKKRVYTEDNEMFVTSVNILRETGGNLAETFDTIVGVIRERVRLQLKIDTYVASGKFQAYTIGSMPFVMIMLFGTGDPEYFPLLFGTILGIVALAVICGLVAFGMWVIFKIIDIKV